MGIPRKDMMGFADSEKLYRGRNLTIAGIACTIVGCGMAVAGTMISDKAAVWFQGTTDEHTQCFSKWCADMWKSSTE